MSDITEREFLAQLAEQSAKLTREIELHAIGLDTSADAIAERRRRVLQGDFWFFATTYFPHHIFGEPSVFQTAFAQRFPQLLMADGSCNEWWVAPRGECKSTLLTKIGSVYISVLGLLQRPEVRNKLRLDQTKFLDYVIVGGAETRLPQKICDVIKTELTNNANLAMDFADAVGAGDTWRIGDFVTKTGVKFEARGAEQAVRGTFHGASRPSVILLDDIITDAEAKSATERDNRYNWINKTIDFLGPPGGGLKAFGVGTILNKDDPISRLKKTPGVTVHHFRALITPPSNTALWEQCEQLMRNDDPVAIAKLANNNKIASDADLPSYQFYIKHKKRMDKGAQSSWPSVRSIYALMKSKIKNARAFATEMQGDGRDDDDRVFTDIRYYVQIQSHWRWFGACDPSLGKNEKSDPSAITVGAYCRDKNILHVELADIKRRVISKLGADLVSVQREYSCNAIAFENNNAYEHSRQTFMAAGLDAGVPLPLVGVTAVVAPEIRIDSLEPYINDIVPRIVFRAELHALLAELDEWPEKQSHHHFDGLNALHLLWMIASTRSGPRDMRTRRVNHYKPGYD